MKNLQEATERICELKGSLVALDALVPAVIQALPASIRARLMDAFDAHAEAARTALLYADVSDFVLATFERDIARDRAFVLARVQPESPAISRLTVDTLLLATTCITVFAGARSMASASGFFFRGAHGLFLVSSRDVFANAVGDQRPDRIEIGVHVDPLDLMQHRVVSLPLHRGGLRLWREARDAAGDDAGDDTSDIAVLEIPAASLPADATVQAFDETHLETRGEQIVAGDVLTIAGFPAGFHDAVHHLAVACSAAVASAYGVRFQGRGGFLTDTRTPCGSNGSPVVRRRLNDGASAPSWQLLGVHASRADLGERDGLDDASPGLNFAWYADVLPTLIGRA